jgi:phosphoserine phosphatase RsbU/P
LNPQPTSKNAIDPLSLLDAVGQAVIVTEPDGTILLFNRAAEELFGWAADEVLGRPVLAVTPAEHVTAEVAAALAQVRSGQAWTGELSLRRRDGTPFLGAVTSRPVRDATGRYVALVGTTEDITDSRFVAEALRRSEQRLRLAVAAGHLGVWAWDADTGEVEWDEAMESLFGFPVGTFPGTFDAYTDRLHPEDRDQVLATVDHAMETRQGFSVEHRLVRPDGSVRWVHGSGQPVVEGDRARGLVGVSIDVTERHQAEVERSRLLRAEAAARAEAEAARARLEFLADAAGSLAEPLGLDERVDRLCRLGVDDLADITVVHLFDDHGRLVPAAVHHRNPDQTPLLGDLLQRYPIHIDTSIGVGAAVREATTVWIPDIDDELLRRAARSQAQLDDVRSLRLRSGLVVPLIGPDGPFGAATFATVGDRRLGDDDVALAEELCRRVGSLVHNARLIEAREQDRLALRYQAALLQAVFEASVDGMLAVAPDGTVLAHNQRFLELWGLDASLIERGDGALLQAASQRVADPEAFVATVRGAYAERDRALHDEVVLCDGRVLDRHGTLVVDDDGLHVGFTWSFRDVTVERTQQAEIVAAGERFATLARTLQQSLLPPSLPTTSGLELAARYRPAFEGIEVGGDFYDVFAVGDDWMLVIGDVCGKGAEAAQLTALARYTIRAAAIHDTDPSAVLTELNAAMVAHLDASAPQRRFATVCCIHLAQGPDAVTARIACGGHPLPHVLRADGSVEEVGRPGTLLGLFPSPTLTTTSARLAPGDTLVTVTDGVIEAGRGGELLGSHGLAAVLATQAGRPPAEVAAAVEDRAVALHGAVLRDDVAVLVARVRPVG